MFRLEEIGYLYLLLLIPLFYIVYQSYVKQTKIAWEKLGYKHTLRKSRLLIRDNFNIKLLLILSVAILGIFALTNPQYGKKSEKIKTQSIDVFIALDVSQSMLCTDIKPNRLSRAQIWIKQFLDRFHTERIGFISFAGRAYMHAPLTTDIPTIHLMASMAGPNNIGTQGTAIAEAIRLATKSFAKEDGFHKVILLISDGEDHEGEVMDAVKQAGKKGISIFTVPIGTTQGAPVPNPNFGTQNYKMDEKGELIISKPNRDLLNEIAEATQAELLEIQNGDVPFEILKKRFALLSKKDVTYHSFSSYESYYQYILFLAFGILIFETILTRKKNAL